MNVFSYTQPIFSKEAEEQMVADLTTEEKEAIEDDLKGRLLDDVVLVDDDDNLVAVGDQGDGGGGGGGTEIEVEEEREDNNDTNNNDDIDPQLLRDFMTAIDEIPIEDKADYMRALIINESLFETECNPIRFLRCENYNAKLAARRMVKYWKMRVRIFGNERAFLRMTLNDGALQDIVHSWGNIPSCVAILPTDIKGRTVIFFGDRKIMFDAVLKKNIPSLAILRMFWYVTHVALQRHHTQRHGVVLISISRDVTSNGPLFNRKETKLVVQSCIECLPIKFCSVHSFPSRVASTLILPAIRLLMTTFYRTRHVIHSSELSTPEICRELREYGLLRNRLPPRLGGTYDIENWFRQRIRIDNEE